MKDDEALDITVVIPNPHKLLFQFPNEPPPQFPFWCVNLAQIHDGEILPPGLPDTIVYNYSIDMIYIVGANPVSIYLPPLTFLWRWDITR